jgi:flagellar protein FliO/FliZ
MSIPSFRKAVTAATAFLLLAPAYALGADTSTTSTTSKGENTPLDLPTSTDSSSSIGGGHSSSGSIVRTVVGLAIVIGVIWGITWVLKQIKQSREERTRGGSLSTEAVVALGPGRSLHLIRAGRELLLVGVADHGVVPIRTYTEEEARAAGLDVDAADEPPSGDGGAGGRRPPTMGQFVDKLRERTVR